MTKTERMQLNEHLTRAIQQLAGNGEKHSALYALLREAQQELRKEGLEELRKERRKWDVVS